LAPSYHADAATVVTTPGTGEMELPEDRFGDVLLPPFVEDASKLHRVGFSLTVSAPTAATVLQSPSHTIRIDPDEDHRFQVELARASDLPDRDLILDISFKQPRPLLYRQTDGAGKTSVAAFLPSTLFGEVEPQPSKTVFVLDRSGSMEGEPMAQAKKALLACLGALSPDDLFTVLAFDHEVSGLSSELLCGDDRGRLKAEQFLGKVQARGGTEMSKALTAASKLIRETGGDIFLITDGQVWETETIITTTRRLGIRVHVLGIGSASQDRFLTLLARKTGGFSRFLSPRERVDLPALELYASIAQPVATNCRLSLGEDTDLVPEPPDTVFAGQPVLCFGESENPHALRISWVGGNERSSIILDDWHPLESEATFIRLIRGARLITDLESQLMESEQDEDRTARRTV
ncbi:MAG: VWA domain-containing protein, partial [Verrucomicrobiota bacterium]